MNCRKLILLLPLILTSCAFERSLVLPGPPELPSKWGQYQFGYADSSGCPAVEGLFSALPQVATYMGREVVLEEGHRLDLYGVFPFPDAQSTSRRVPFVREDSRVLKIERTGERLIVEYHGAEGTTIETHVFHSGEEDFNCSLGLLDFGLFQLNGQIEGVAMNGQIRRSLARSTDGSLVAIVTSGPSALNREPRASDFVHEFYRFREL